METYKNLIGGVLLGSLIGVTVGVLFAPESGAKTQKKLIKKTSALKDDLFDSVVDSIEALRAHFNERVDQLANQTKRAANTASKKATGSVKSV